MIYKEYLPGAALAPYIECYWQYATGHEATGELSVQRCLPLGTAELILQVNGQPCSIGNNAGIYEDSAPMYFTGLYTSPAYWKPRVNTLMFGIRLKPESIWVLFGVPARDIFNSVVDAGLLPGHLTKMMADEMTGVFAVHQLISITEKYLLRTLENFNNKRDYVSEACNLMRRVGGDISIESISRKLYISKRNLERCFRDQLGITPKMYQRIIRFREAYTQIRSSDSALKWSDIYYGSGYSDHAHFIREFKTFTEDIPTSLTQNSGKYFQTLEVSLLN